MSSLIPEAKAEVDEGEAREVPPPATSKRARQAKIISLIDQAPIASQAELRRQLAGQGYDVTQPTLSKDLVEIGAIKVRGPDGSPVYAILDEPGSSPTHQARLGRICAELLLQAEAAGNLVVAHLPPGAAQYFASAIDRAALETILGCVAGDDTVIIVCRSEALAGEVAEGLLAQARQ